MKQARIGYPERTHVSGSILTGRERLTSGLSSFKVLGAHVSGEGIVDDHGS